MVTNKIQLNTIEEAIEDIRQGKIIIVVDDEDRENEGDFLAAAENTESTYDDGEVFGSIIGRIDIETMKIDFTKVISNSHKFEGLTVFKDSNEKIEFLLCEDTDSDVLETQIYKFTLDKNFKN